VVGRPLVATVGSVVDLVWTSGQDWRLQLTGYAPRKGESRLVAARRGVAVAPMQRVLRERSFARVAGPVAPGPSRAIGLALLVAIVVVAVRLAPQVASGIASDLTRTGWLAGLLDALSSWWNHLPGIEKFVLLVLLSAVLALAFNSLGLGFGIAGVVVWALKRERGLRSFVDDPRRAARSYFTTVTPTEFPLDVLSLALTFFPIGKFAAGPALAADEGGMTLAQLGKEFAKESGKDGRDMVAEATGEEILKWYIPEPEPEPELPGPDSGSAAVESPPVASTPLPPPPASIPPPPPPSMPATGVPNSFGYDASGRLMRYAAETPSAAPGQLEAVWARDSAGRGFVEVTGADGQPLRIEWSPGQPAGELWQLGTRPGAPSFAQLRDLYLSHQIPEAEFLRQVHDADNFVVQAARWYGGPPPGL
jgi:hypothetical protein